MKINVNNIDYSTRKTPVVGICMDGTSYDYYEAAANVMPNLQKIMRSGSLGFVQSVIPSFTNPNNMAIATGVTPDLNGICGNYYYNTETGEEVMMNDPEFLKVPTIFEKFSQNGQKVAVVTAKDKLRKMLSKNLNGICFSAEFADKVNMEDNGISNVIDNLMGKPNPGIYDPEISVYCIEAGVKLLERERYDLMYLTTTDFVQHKYAPSDPEAKQFLHKIDQWIGELDRLGAIVGVTADHGMSAKTKIDGSPKVEFLETLLEKEGNIKSRVILPITDPYVVHHGALGSYGTVYLEDEHIEKAKKIIQNVPGMELVLTKNEAVERFNLPNNLIGELVVLSDEETVIGRSKDWHDLEKVKSGLRSHGGLHESEVPMIINRPVNDAYIEKLASGKARNFQLFDFLFNGVID